MTADDAGADGTIAEDIARYADLVERSPHNLLSARGLRELRTRHIPEAVAFATMLPAGPARVLDVGSGGGLPGAVVAIVRPDLEVHLLEATIKKARFLAEVAAALGDAFTVHAGRAEDLVHRTELRVTFDVVTARAVAPLERLAPLCAPFLHPGGRLYAIKGERWPDELASARDTLKRLGMCVVSSPHEAPPSSPEPLVVVLERQT